MSSKLTVKEALDAGYHHYRADGDYLQEIEDIDEDDEFPHGAVLYSSVGTPSVQITKEIISDLLSDWAIGHVEDKCDNETVVNRAYEKILKADFTETAKMINSLFEKDIVYQSTDIELIP